MRLMNKFIIMIVMLFSVNLVISSPINANSPLMEVEIRSGIDPQRRLVDYGIHRSYTWTFENADYTVIYAIDQQDYSRIRNDHRKRRYNHDHFAPMVYRGVESLEKLIREFNQVIPRSWTQKRKVNFVLAFVTATISYEYDKTTGYNEYYKHPIETITEGVGDCEDTSILFASILSGLDFESALLVIPPVLDRRVGHIAVGVKGNFPGWYVNYKDDKYFFCETAADRKVFKVGMLSEEYENVPMDAIPIKRQPVPSQKVRPRTVQPTPKPPATPSPQISLKNGIALFYRARYNEAIKSLQLALSGLNDPKERAEVYIYLGKTEYTFPGDSLSNSKKRAEDRFEQALRENPEQEIDGQKFKDLFEKVHEKSIGKLTVSASLPQTEIWIYGNGIERKKLNTGTNPITIKLFKGNYTLEGIYDGKLKEQTIEIEPKITKELKFEVLPLYVDNNPPIIRLINPPQTADVNQEMAIQAKITDNRVVKLVNFYYGFSRYKRSEPARYSKGVIRHIKQSDIYTGIISSQDKVGYIWYYLTATDREGNEGKTQKRVLEIKPISEDTPSPPDNQPPRIVLQNTIQTANVNQRISVKAKVTDDKAVRSVYLFYSFSHSNISPPEEYNWKELTGNPLGIYSGYIPPQNEEGYIWYYIGAIDNAGEDERSKKEKLRIKRDEPYSPPKSEDKPSIIVLNQTSVYQGIWAKYAWPREVFEDSGSIFDLNRGNAIGLTYLREGRTSRTFGVELDYSRQNPSNMSAIFQWGPALGKSPLTFTLLGGFAGYGKPDSTRTISYGTFIFGAGLKYYPWDRVAIDAIGSLKYKSNFDTTYRYHYEVGTRIYITDALNLKIGYSRWYLGSRNVARIQVGLGITF